MTLKFTWSFNWNMCYSAPIILTLSICGSLKIVFNSTVLSGNENENSRKSFAVTEENIFKESIKGEISLGGIHVGMYDTNISV